MGAGWGVLGEAEGEVGGVGCRHGDDVGVEDGAGVAAGAGAGDRFGDEGVGDALFAMGGGDEEALDLAGGLRFACGVTVGDAAGGDVVGESEQELSVGGCVGRGEGGDLFEVAWEVEAVGAGDGLEEVAVGGEETARGVDERRSRGDALDSEHVE